MGKADQARGARQPRRPESPGISLQRPRLRFGRSLALRESGVRRAEPKREVARSCTPALLRRARTHSGENRQGTGLEILHAEPAAATAERAWRGCGLASRLRSAR